MSQWRMRWGGLEGSRADYLSRKNPNLQFLLAGRAEWMNDWIDPSSDAGVEVGCGIGFSKDFIRARSYQLTDIQNLPWVDVSGVDAMATPFDDRSMDFVVANNMVHHVAQPIRFFREMARILKPGGRLLIQDMHASLATRGMLTFMRHESYSFDVDVFDEASICNNPDHPWSANCAIPTMLFRDLQTFHRGVPQFEVLSRRYTEFLTWLNSGGVNAKTYYLPLGPRMLNAVAALDRILVGLAPDIFAMEMQAVLKKRTT
jgi:SAM-dependent methyltransferase